MKWIPYIVIGALITLIILKGCADKKTSDEALRKSTDSLTDIQHKYIAADSVLRVKYRLDTLAKILVIDSLKNVNAAIALKMEDYKNKIRLTVSDLSLAIANQPDSSLILKFDSLKKELSETGNALTFWQTNTNLKDSLLYALHQSDALVIAAKDRTIDSLNSIDRARVQIVDKYVPEKFMMGLNAGLSGNFAAGGLQFVYKNQYMLGVDYTTLNSFYIHVGLIKPLKF